MGLGDDVRVSVPSVSWARADLGDKVSGIILPVWDDQGVEHLTRETQQTDMDSGEKKFFSDGTPRMQDHFVIQTKFRNFEFTSKEFAAMAKSEELEDDGIRQVIIKTYSTKPAKTSIILFKRRMKRVPAAGDYIEFTNFSETAGPGGKGRMLKTAFAPGDERSMAVAAEYRELNAPTPPPAPAPDAFSGPDFISADPAAIGDDDLPEF